MATSRTGTAKWKAVVEQVRRHAIREGVTQCPRCRVTLDWQRKQQANSVEVDHIVPHYLGGADSAENARILCRTCNRSLGAQLMHAKRRAGGKPPPTAPVPSVTFAQSDAW